MKKGFAHLTILTMAAITLILIAASLVLKLRSYERGSADKLSEDDSELYLNSTSPVSDLNIINKNTNRKIITPEGFIKKENGWSYFENKEFNFTFKVPETWEAVIFTNHPLLGSQDYEPLVRVLTPKGDDDMCHEALEIGYPIKINGEHKDIGKNFERGLEGLNEKYKGSEFGYFDGYKALFFLEKGSSAPENFQGGWCNTNYELIYIDLNNGTIMEIVYSWESDSEVLFKEILNSIDFKK